MAKAKRGQGEPTVIKKYANRRLYDTGRSSYVTLDDLCEMTREGYEFVVYDAKTGEDITRSVLAQIMAEKESKDDGENLLPVNFMRQLIGLYGGNMQGLVPNYLENAFDLFMKNQERMREQISKSFEGMNTMNPMKSIGNIGMFPGASAIEELNRQNAAMIERTMKMFTPFGMSGASEKAAASSRSEGSANSNKEDKIRELRQNIAEMQKELNRMAAE
jgi:polyhydroxyalkanoate synthesis repressor PhaR